MKFYIQWDGPKATRAHKTTWGPRNSTFDCINAAMYVLKTKLTPHRLCYDEPGARGATTLVFFEGTNKIGTFTAKKISTLEQIGIGMYIPARLTRKTNIRRKTKCKKSSLLNTLKASAKSTP